MLHARDDGVRLILQDATRRVVVDDVKSFVGEDASGSFGILPGHDRLVSCLEIGLAKFRARGEDWQYLAVPGAVLQYRDQEIVISARRFVLEANYEEVCRALSDQLLAEETELHKVKSSLQRLEDELLRRLRYREP